MSNSMKIGFSLSPYQEHSGVGVYCHNLIRQLVRLAPQHNYFAFVAKESVSRAQQNLAGVQIFPTPIPNGPSWKRGIASLWFRRICQRFASIDLDILHSFSFPGFLCAGVNLLTVYDMRAEDVPAVNKLLRNYYARFMKRSALLRMDGILAISDFTRSRLLCHYPDAAGKTFVTKLGGGERFDASATGARPIDSPYVLVVSHIMPRKNLGFLIEGFDRLLSGVGCPHKLLIVGKRYESDEKFDRALSAARHKDRILIQENLSEGQLAAAYQYASLFVFPSLYEGFGIPVLEASAFGVPVLAANSSVFPEMLGRTPEYMFDPQSIDDLVGKMKMLLFDDNARQKASSALRTLCAKMTWEKMAIETLQVYQLLYQKKVQGVL